MKFLNFTIIKLTFFLIIGILIGYFFDVSLIQSSYILGILLVLFISNYLYSKNRFTTNAWFGAMAFASMISFGVFIVNIHNPKNNSNHYTSVVNTTNDSIKNITIRIREILKPGHYYDKYVVDILKADSIKVTGKTMLNVKKDSLSNTLNIDDVFITRTNFKEIFPPLNPGQFNYKRYLEKQHIYHQLFVSNKDLLKFKTNQKTLFGYTNGIREYINSKLKQHDFKPDELAIINAILLGQRQNISENMYSNYANAGAIHILAISGLHIGIILLMLTFIFKPLERLKHGLYVKTILIVMILWSFAFIAGLSASVTRAVTMFSIVAIGLHLKRPTNIYNTLAISIFVLLLFKPLFLFDVGFQLSYLAVFGIVSIDPYLYALWKPKYWLIRKYWHTLTITMSAQFGILPISLFYFHQFPGLFFLSNLLIIPFLGIILGLGIGVILLASLNILPEFLVKTFAYVISLMNSIVEWVANQNTFLFKNISFNFLYVIASYIFIVCLVRFCIKRNYKRLVWMFIAVIIGQSAIIYTKWQSPKNQFLIFHKSRFSLLANIHNGNMAISHNLDSLSKNKNNIVNDFIVENHINSLQEDSLDNVYVLKNKKLLVIDSLGIYQVTFNPQYVLLRNSPKINLYRLIDSLKPKTIIADGSNYKTYIERWKATCLKTKTPFHQTSKKGAFIINY